MWRNGKSRGLSQETWGPATCAVRPGACLLTPLCLIVLTNDKLMAKERAGISGARAAKHLDIMTPLILILSLLNYIDEEF